MPGVLPPQDRGEPSKQRGLVLRPEEFCPRCGHWMFGEYRDTMCFAELLRFYSPEVTTKAQREVEP